jgi:hypothetical protein
MFLSIQGLFFFIQGLFLSAECLFWPNLSGLGDLTGVVVEVGLNAWLVGK